MRFVFLGVMPLLLLAGPACAVDVTFSGTLSGSCSLGLSVPGTLALSVDGQRLGSEETGGLAATLTVLSVGSNTITVEAPTRTAAPVGYNATGETIEVAYTGQGGLSAVSEPYSAAGSDFPIATLPLTNLIFNARINNANGFDAGTYGVRTVVTCS
jgi:hypothetical protein